MSPSHFRPGAVAICCEYKWVAKLHEGNQTGWMLVICSSEAHRPPRACSRSVPLQLPRQLNQIPNGDLSCTYWHCPSHLNAVPQHLSTSLPITKPGFVRAPARAGPGVAGPPCELCTSAPPPLPIPRKIRSLQ